MRENTTTWQRAIEGARKLQPVTKQKDNSLFFDVASTTVINGIHHVTLGPNKFNPLLDSVCDCGHSKYGCLHRGAAFLKYTANLETRLENGYNYLHSDNQLTEIEHDDLVDTWKDLLNRYERCCDLLRAIELGLDISNLRTAFKNLLPTKEGTQQLLSA